jgi:hypothetical protein
MPKALYSFLDLGFGGKVCTMWVLSSVGLEPAEMTLSSGWVAKPNAESCLPEVPLRFHTESPGIA